MYVGTYLFLVDITIPVPTSNRSNSHQLHIIMAFSPTASVLRAAANTSLRQVHITTQPAPRTLRESRMVLAALQKFGEVVTYQNFRVGAWFHIVLALHYGALAFYLMVGFFLVGWWISLIGLDLLSILYIYMLFRFLGGQKCPPGSLPYVWLIYSILIVTTSNDGAPFEWKRPLGLEGLSDFQGRKSHAYRPLNLYVHEKNEYLNRFTT